MIRIRTVALTLVVLLVAIQLVPIRHDNPPAAGPLTVAPVPVLATLHRACYNCHSVETVWPWYSYVAPVSWLVARDVHEARRRLNFSEWAGYTPELTAKKLAGISTLVQEKDMPPWFYLPLHAEARLSDDDIMVVSMWADGITQ